MRVRVQKEEKPPGVTPKDLRLIMDDRIDANCKAIYKKAAAAGDADDEPLPVSAPDLSPEEPGSHSSLR